MSEKTGIFVAGAGIAGLTTALALARRGLPVTIADAFDEPSEVGAGLQVAPNASAILHKLGVLEALLEKSVTPTAIRLGDAPSGRIVLDMAVTPAWLERMGAPYLTAHRASLHGVLYTAVQADPNITVMTGHKVTGATQDADAVTVTLESNGETSTVMADMLIGADGVWSAVRSAVGRAAQPVATGRIAWRAVGPASPDGANKVTAWMAPDSHLVTYPVRNSETLNIVAVTHGRLKPGEWAQPIDQPALAGLLKSAAQITDLGAIDKVNWTAWPLHTVDPSGEWSDGRILLVGDAAHALEPFAAQGAAMAIEDGYAAALAIAGNPSDPAATFAAYRRLRFDRILRVAKRTAFNRWTYHQGGAGRIARNTFLSMRSADAFFADLDWLYGYRIPE